MAYEISTGTNPRALPKFQKQYAYSFKAGDNAKLDATINDGAKIEVGQINVTQEDIDALPANHELRAIIRIDLVPYYVSP